MITILNGNEYLNAVPERSEFSHKGTFGTAGLVCGSINYQGAAYFSVTAALRTGVGIAVAFIPDCIYLPFSAKVNGAVIEPLNSIEGCISDLYISKKIEGRKCTAVLCGSGLGISDDTARTVYSVSRLDIPVVFDGDALSMISKDKSILERSAATVITPHIGEFSKLCNKDPSYVRKNRVTLASRFAVDYGITVVLKDYVTVIADKSGDSFILSDPTSALSKGGSGDVLAGLVVSFLAQGYSCLDSAVFAVTLHNASGKLCERRCGVFYTQPDDIINNFSKLLF